MGNVFRKTSVSFWRTKQTIPTSHWYGKAENRGVPDRLNGQILQFAIKENQIFKERCPKIMFLRKNLKVYYTISCTVQRFTASLDLIADS
jgi:hypothetical protein